MKFWCMILVQPELPLGIFCEEVFCQKGFSGTPTTTSLNLIKMIILFQKIKTQLEPLC